MVGNMSFSFNDWSSCYTSIFRHLLLAHSGSDQTSIHKALKSTSKYPNHSLGYWNDIDGRRNALFWSKRSSKTDSSFQDRKSTRLNSSHVAISYAVFCLKKKNKQNNTHKKTQIK